MENDERLEDTWYGQHEANRREVYIENIPQVWREPIITNIQADLPPRCDKGLSGVKRRTAICALRTRVCALHTCASRAATNRGVPSPQVRIHSNPIQSTRDPTGTGDEGSGGGAGRQSGTELQ